MNRLHTLKSSQRRPASSRAKVMRVESAVLVLILLGIPGIAKAGTCGQPITNVTSPIPTASDALYILRASVGGAECTPCLCDTNNDSRITGADALTALRCSVGAKCNLSCTVCDEVCGDGARVGSEQCDDRNLVDGDGCDHLCRIEPKCGNGIREGTEECDDGNVADGDGCNHLCHTEAPCADIEGGWTSTGTAKICCSLDGDQQCGRASSTGRLYVNQDQCRAWIDAEVLDFDITLKGPVTHTTLTLSSPLVPRISGVHCNKNELVEMCVIKSPKRLECSVNGGADCDVAGYRLVCSASGTDVWTR